MKTSLYSFTSITCLFVLSIILVKCLSKKLHDNFSKSFKFFLILTIIYCIIDFFFGTTLLNLNDRTSIVCVISLNLFYITGSFTAYVWSVLMSMYIDESFSKHKLFATLTLIPFIAVIVLLVVNVFNPIIFTVQSNTFSRKPGRISIYFIDLFYYLSILIIGALLFIKSKDTENRNKGKFVCIYSLVPCITLIHQIVFSGAPYYTMGIMVSVLIIFSFISTSEFETVTVKRHEIENLRTIVENEKVIISIADTFVSAHKFYLNENKSFPFKSPEFIDKFIIDPNDAQNNIIRAMESLTAPQYKPKMMDFIRLDTVADRLGNGNEISYEFLGTHSGYCVASWIRLENDSTGKCVKAIFAVRLIDEEKRREIEMEKKFKQAILNQNEIFGEILQNQSTGTIVINTNNKILALNSRIIKILNLHKDNLETYTIDDLIANFKSPNKPQILKKLATIKANGGFYTYEFETESEDKVLSNFRADAKQVKLSNGEKVLIISVTDITANKEMEKELITLSETDSLTGINNRGSGEHKTEELLKNGKTGMLCLLDADKFKSINDTFGHHVGDKVIIEIANALKRSFRDRDIIMRLGGDEFAMFAVGCVDQEAGNKCMERFFDHVNKIEIKEMGNSKISVSVGCVLCTDNEKYSFDDYYQMADSAMYFSKSTPGNSYTFHRSSK